jgi:hypothetical protein
VLAISEDGAWWLIDYENAPDEPAWVSAEFVTFTGEKESVPVFGEPSLTPTPVPVDTPVSTSSPVPAATITIPAEQPTYAPSATSIYEATSSAMLATRGTPEPLPAEESVSGQTSLFNLENIPWGVLSVVVIVGFLWYQFVQRRRRI